MITPHIPSPHPYLQFAEQCSRIKSNEHDPLQQCDMDYCIIIICMIESRDGCWAMHLRFLIDWQCHCIAVPLKGASYIRYRIDKAREPRRKQKQLAVQSAKTIAHWEGGGSKVAQPRFFFSKKCCESSITRSPYTARRMQQFTNYPFDSTEFVVRIYQLKNAATLRCKWFSLWNRAARHPNQSTSTNHLETRNQY